MTPARQGTETGFAGFLMETHPMSLQTRLDRLEAANAPTPGELPHVVHWPDDDPREQARIAADVAERERAGQRCVVVRGGENPLEQLVEHFL